MSVTPLGDLLAAHVDAGIELRFVPSLWPLHDLAVSEAWEFGIVRIPPRPSSLGPPLLTGGSLVTAGLVQ